MRWPTPLLVTALCIVLPGCTFSRPDYIAPGVAVGESTFVEDWREATMLLLAGDAYFPPLEPRGDLAIQSVKSGPASGATEAYLLFLLTIESARASIKITNPYFVPDGRMARALAEAARRGVDVTLITAGPEEWRRHAHRHLMYLPLIPLRDQL